ncbi:MAG: hypothetical protein KIT84_13010 [Labilithrix sp.]|nr:hypothetical protein [Labilithrix sp.]MCW5811935.1 hypothetical protein [Labilithrix sp.]
MSLRSFVLVASAAVLAACTLTRSLDYLQAGDGGAGTGASSSTSTSTSSTSSSGDLDPDAQAAGEVIAPQQSDPSMLRQDGDSVYWVTLDNKLRRVAKSGGAVQELGAYADVIDVAVDPAGGNNVYVLTPTAVRTLPKAGGDAVDLVTLPATHEPLGVVVDATYLFVLLADTTDYRTQLLRYSKANVGAPANLATANESDPYAIALAGGKVFWNALNQAGSYVVHELAVDAPPGTAPTAYKGTGEGISVFQQGDLVADERALYWLDDLKEAPFVLIREPLGAPEKLLNSAEISILTVNSKFIYMAKGDVRADRIIVRPKEGGDLEELASQPGPASLVADDAALYVAFAGVGSGGIQKIPLTK